MEPWCELCKSHHHPRQAHRFGVAEDPPGSDKHEVVNSPVGVAGKKQRWSRDKYNAYQREYMRRRRALP